MICGGGTLTRRFRFTYDGIIAIMKQKHKRRLRPDLLLVEMNLRATAPREPYNEVAVYYAFYHIVGACGKGICG
jgi:hypothetical protein